MNRYFLFAGENYYPAGGMDDFIGHYATMTELVQNTGHHDWFNILDTKTGKVIEIPFMIKPHKIKDILTEWAAQWAKNHDENAG